MERLTMLIDSHLLDNGKLDKEYSLTDKMEFNEFSCIDIPNAVYNKLGELEDMLEKYGIETTEELDGVLKPLIDNGELENWRRVIFWKAQNERLKQELAELKQKAIVPKYKTGDKVYGIIDTWAYTDVRPVEIRDTHLLYEVWDGEDTTKQHSTRIFATKEEAEQKLAEIGGKE